jgi:hypothetical protein
VVERNCFAQPQFLFNHFEPNTAESVAALAEPRRGGPETKFRAPAEESHGLKTAAQDLVGFERKDEAFDWQLCGHGE